MNHLKQWIALACALAGMANLAGARELDDYLGGTEVVDVEHPGEFQWQTTGIVARHGWSDSMELEYGIAAQWQISVAFGYGRQDAAEAGEEDSAAGGRSHLWSAEMEARWRLDTARLHWPCEVALAMGMQSDWQSHVSQQWTAEPRLILQKTMGKFSASANLGAELGKQGSFTPSLGARYAVCESVALACEVLEDFRDHTTVALPQLILRPSKEITIMAGCALSGNRERNAQAEVGLIWDL